MPSSTYPKKIILKGDPIRKEDEAGGVITPGHLLNYDASGDLVAHATAGGNAAPAFAVEQDFLGKTINDNYASEDRVQYVVARPGDEIYAFLAALQSVLKGAFLESAGNGSLREHSPSAASVAEQAIAAALVTGVEGDNNAILWTARDTGSAGNGISITMLNTAVGAALSVDVIDNNITVTLAETAAAAAGATGVEGDNNGLTWTAQEIGTEGDNIVIVLQDPGANDQDLAITVAQNTIIISLATDGGGAITTTGAQLIAAITEDTDPAYNADAAALVTVDDTGASTGAVAVTDETVQLSGGADAVITSTAAQVIAAIQASSAANALVTVDNEGDSTGAGAVEAVATVNLSGGIDEGEITSTGGTIYQRAIVARALEDVDNSTVNPVRIKVEVI